MKIAVTLGERPRLFTPMEVSIRIDSEEEFRALSEFMGWNIAVPMHLREKGHMSDPKLAIVTDFMLETQQKLNEAWKGLS